MTNYYEILEVSKNASRDVIEKAYKTLAKKYHPDVQQEGNKKQAEEKMKKLNEAYEVLCNEEKKKEYDLKLEQFLNEESLRNAQSVQNAAWESHGTEDQRRSGVSEDDLRAYVNLKREEQDVLENNPKLRREIEKETKRKYVEAHEDYLRSLGYRIRYKWTWKRVKNLMITLGATILVCYLLWLFPPVNKMLKELYEENQLVKILVDILFNILKAIGNMLKSLVGSFKKT